MRKINQEKYPSSQQTYNDKESLFLAYLGYYKGTFTYCSELQVGMKNDCRLEWADSIKEFKQCMAVNPDFEDRHFHKVDTAYEHFEQRCKQAGLQLPASADDVP